MTTTVKDTPRRVGPVNRCPHHNAELDGGPVQYRCPHGHRVMAADLTREISRAVN